MTTTTVSPGLGVGRSAIVQPRKMRPILWWAGIGAGFLVLQVYVYARWLLDLPPNIPAGETDAPVWMHALLIVQQILFPVLTLAIVYAWVIRPLRRGRPLSWDALFVLAMQTTIWASSLWVWFSYQGVYNALTVNRGSWYEYIPFWGSPNTNHAYAEFPLIDLGFFTAWAIITIWFCTAMRAARRRWPQMSKFGLFGVALVVCMLFDLTAEHLWTASGAYVFAGAVRGLSLFAGHYYQFPIYETLIFGTIMAAVASLRFFRNDRGESICERGVADLRIGTKSKTWLRFLAISGVLNVVSVAYAVAMVPFAFHAGEWPQDVQRRTYFTQGICGRQPIAENRACPGPNVPIPRRDSAYMTSDGRLANLHPEGGR